MSNFDFPKRSDPAPTSESGEMKTAEAVTLTSHTV